VVANETDKVETPCEEEPPEELLVSALEETVEAGGTTRLELDSEGLITMLERLNEVLLVVTP